MAKQVIVEGATATNHATGERIVYRKGRWYPLGEGGAAPTGGVSGLKDKELKELVDTRQAAQNTRLAREKANEFMDINREVGTGGLMALPLAPEMIGAFNPKVSAMRGLSNAMIPGMHVTPGPMTDADAKLYKSAIPNVNLPGPTNAHLTKSIERQEQQAAARAAFYERWAAKRGTLNGAAQAFNSFWLEYSSKQPRPAVTPRQPARSGSAPAKGSTFKYLGPE